MYFRKLWLKTSQTWNKRPASRLERRAASLACPRGEAWLPGGVWNANESALHIRWPKCWSFSFNISPYNEHSGLISFRMDWLDCLVVQGTLKSLLQHHSSKASILQHLPTKTNKNTSTYGTILMENWKLAKEILYNQSCKKVLHRNR